MLTVPVVTMLLGVAVKMACNYFLVGNPEIHINGAPISTFACYGLISLLNIMVILRVTGAGARLLAVFIKPLVATVIMGILTNGVYRFVMERTSELVTLVFSVITGVGTYLILLLFLRALPEGNPLYHLPKARK